MTVSLATSKALISKPCVLYRVLSDSDAKLLLPGVISRDKSLINFEYMFLILTYFSTASRDGVSLRGGIRDTPSLLELEFDFELELPFPFS